MNFSFYRMIYSMLITQCIMGFLDTGLLGLSIRMEIEDNGESFLQSTRYDINMMTCIIGFSNVNINFEKHHLKVNVFDNS